MGFRFNRRISIFKGLRLSLSKSGPSVSVGGRGAWLTFGKKGTRATVGIPGTGMSWSEKIDSPNPQSSIPDPQSPGQNFSVFRFLMGLVVLAVVLFGLVSSCSASDPIAIDQPTKLRGVVNVVTFPIPKELNDIHWAPEDKTTAYVLVLEGLQTFRGADPANAKVTNVVTLQMVHVIPADEAHLKSRLGKVIDLEGTPEWGSTRYHRTPVLLIEKPAK